MIVFKSSLLVSKKYDFVFFFIINVKIYRFNLYLGSDDFIEIQIFSAFIKYPLIYRLIN